MSDTENEAAPDIPIEGTILNDRWLAITCIGGGTFATIWLVRDLGDPSERRRSHKYHESRKKKYGHKRQQKKKKKKQSTSSDDNDEDDIDMGHYFAMKIFSHDQTDETCHKEAYKSELEIMDKLMSSSCDGVMFWIDKFKHILNGNTHRAFILPLCKGSLFCAMPKDGFGISMVRQILWKIFQSIKVIHDVGYAHGDIKPENILIEGFNNKTVALIRALERRIDFKHFSGKPRHFPELERLFRREMNKLLEKNTEIVEIRDRKFKIDADCGVRISDYGSTKPFNSGISNSKTVYYDGIEGLMEIRIDDNRKTDIWALACLAWELVTGNILFNGEDEYDSPLEAQGTLLVITQTLGAHDPYQMLQQSTLFSNVPKSWGFERLIINPVVTVDGFIKGEGKLRPRLLSDMLKESLQIPTLQGNQLCAEFLHLMYNMLIYNPDKRPTIDQLLQHPFFFGEKNIIANPPRNIVEAYPIIHPISDNVKRLEEIFSPQQNPNPPMVIGDMSSHSAASSSSSSTSNLPTGSPLAELLKTLQCKD
jgi:serine/threonine protein kinase